MSDTEEKTAASNFNDAGEYIGPESVTIPLTREVKLHKDDPNPIREITLVEPTVDQMSDFQDEANKTRNDFKAGAVLISKNAGIGLPQAKKLSTRDFQKALTFLTGFIPPGPKENES